MAENLDKSKQLKDEHGKPMTYADGSPILHSHFQNDPTDEAFEREEGQTEEEFLEEILDLDLDLTDEQMMRMGFLKKEGKWTVKEKQS